MKNYIIVSNRNYHPDWLEFSNPEILKNYINTISPNVEVIFFPFWSWKVSKEILGKYECIGFHTGTLSGGSPIQNLIRMGECDADLWMFCMSNKIDEGKGIDYRKIELYGTLEEILMRESKLIMEMIDGYQTNSGQPTPTKH